MTNMYYVCCEDGIYGEYEKYEEAEVICDRLNSRGEDAWISADDAESDDDYFDDYDSDFGYDPYMGCYTYDC